MTNGIKSIAVLVDEQIAIVISLNYATEAYLHATEAYLHATEVNYYATEVKYFGVIFISLG